MRKATGVLDPIVPDQAMLVVVGECPTVEDRMAGCYLAQSEYSGILINALQAAGCHDYAYTVACPEAQGKPKAADIKAWQPVLHDFLVGFPCRTVMTLGATALSAVAGKTGVMQLHGVPFEHEIGGEVFTIIPAVSPSYVVRDHSALGMFCDDVCKAVSVSEGGQVVYEYDYRLVNTDAAVRKLVKDLAGIAGHYPVAWDIETTGLQAYSGDAEVVCLTVSWQEESGLLVPVNHPESRITRPVLYEFLSELLVRQPHRLIGQNLKFDMGYMQRCFPHLGSIRMPVFDTMIANHLLHEEDSAHGGNGLKEMARAYTPMGGYELPFLERYGKKKAYESMQQLSLSDSGRDSLLHYACGDVDAVIRIYERLAPEIDEQGLGHVMAFELEKMGFLLDIEARGACIDWARHATLKNDCEAQRKSSFFRLQSFPAVVDLFGEESFNPGSTQQVCLMADRLGWPDTGRTTDKGATSVDKKAIDEWLRLLPANAFESREILAELRRYKELQKIESAYLDGYEALRCSDNRLHARFNQARAVTCRLTSDGPNLQQLPRVASGDDTSGDITKGCIKQLFVPPFPDWVLLEADYSQIELRVAGLLSQDAAFLSAYRNREDLHALTASAAYGVPLRDVTPEQRTSAKAINFGIIYLMGPGTLAETLGIGEDEAAQIISNTMDKYSGYAEWVERTKAEVRRRGYVESLLGHRRHLPEAKSRNRFESERALRQACNHPVQSTASNMCIYAGVLVGRRFKDDGLRAYCFGQVHDSLWVACHEEALADTARALYDVMENLPFPWLRGEDERFPEVMPIETEIKAGVNLASMFKLSRDF